jgi:hypothetical protein
VRSSFSRAAFGKILRIAPTDRSWPIALAPAHHGNAFRLTPVGVEHHDIEAFGQLLSRRLLKQPTRRIRFLTHDEAQRLLVQLPTDNLAHARHPFRASA